MSQPVEQLSKLPKAAHQRFQGLAEYLAAWGYETRKLKRSKQIAEARSRIGGMPKGLKTYFELGIDSWLSNYSRKLKGVLGETWSWVPVEDLCCDSSLRACIIGSAGSNVLTYTIRPDGLSEQDPTVSTYLDEDDDFGWQFGSFSETIIRECLLCLVANAPARCIEIAKKQNDTRSHQWEKTANRKLRRIPVYEDRRGLVEVYAGTDVLLVRRFPPGSEKCDLFLVGKKPSDVKEFLKDDEASAPEAVKPVKKNTGKKRTVATPKVATVSELRSQLRESVSVSDIYSAAAEYIAKTATPCIRFIDAGPLNRAKLGATRIGGYPDLPSDFEWPFVLEKDYENRPLSFIGQFNFRDLPTWRGSPFPKSGILSIFIGEGGFSGSAAGFYFSARQKLVRRRKSRSPSGDGFGEVLSPMKLIPYLGLSIPAYLHGFRDEIASLCRDAPDFDDDYVSENMRDMDQSLQLEGTAGQLGGFAVTPVESHYHEELACKQLRINGYLGPRKSFDVTAIKSKQSQNRVYEGALEQQVAFSLDSSNSSGAMWSDSGILYLIQETALIKEKDFSSIPAFVYH